MKTRNSGFTLIELLIVIALLGTLAVALLAAIDPFEQFKKATDTGVRNTAQEFYNASIRYYAQRNGWPSQWAAEFTDTAGHQIGRGDPNDIVTGLVASSELKQNFVELAEDQLDKIYVARQGESKLMVCFSPQSNSFLNADKNVKFTTVDLDVSGNPSTDASTTAGTCQVHGGAGPCYWCLY
ncbi:MAG: type II secretion system GspH family protein [Candidatus Roizmanbacteria bacterium]|nr:type II secretion system GspH family protein [Candidatus Roizmanbacteria bacterium]